MMLGNPDPRVNLAMTIEMAGKTEDALASYAAALEVWPDGIPAVHGLASLTLLAGRQDERLRAWLERISDGG